MQALENSRSGICYLAESRNSAAMEKPCPADAARALQGGIHAGTYDEVISTSCSLPLWSHKKDLGSFLLLTTSDDCASWAAAGRWSSHVGVFSTRLGSLELSTTNTFCLTKFEVHSLLFIPNTHLYRKCPTCVPCGWLGFHPKKRKFPPQTKEAQDEVVNYPLGLTFTTVPEFSHQD